MNRDARPDRTQELWSWIEGERVLDRRVRRVSKVAWIVTLVALLLYGVKVLVNVVMMLSNASGKGYPPSELLAIALDQALPLITVLGLLSFLVAVLSTIGVFLRFRTASLAEIQTRLAAMEEMLLKDQSRS
jgi:hypothetical protein